MTPLLALLLATQAHAADLSVREPFARASMGAGPGVAYLTITGGDTGDRLVSASSPRAARVVLHSMMSQEGIMRMREVDAMEVPAGATIALRPGGLHLMLEGLSAPLRTGETLTLTLRFEKAGERTLTVPVRGAGATSPQ